MNAIKGTVKYQDKVFNYATQFRERPGKRSPFSITDLSCLDGTRISVERASEELLLLVMRNAILLKWCENEGWQLTPHDTPTGITRCPDGYIQRIRKADALEPPETMFDPIVVEVLNWADEVVEEPLVCKGGVDQFLGSGKYEPFVPYEEPPSALKEGVIYVGENGMLVCCKCAGVRAWSGYDSLGNPLVAVTNAHVKEYRKMFGENMRCEKGCTEWRSSRVLKF